MHWTVGGANAILALRCILSGRLGTTGSPEPQHRLTLISTLLSRTAERPGSPGAGGSPAGVYNVRWYLPRSRDRGRRMPARNVQEPVSSSAPVAQLDRASASGAEGHRFESCRARHLPLRHSQSSKRYGRIGEAVRRFRDAGDNGRRMGKRGRCSDGRPATEATRAGRARVVRGAARRGGAERNAPCGVPALLVVDTDGTSQREAFRRSLRA